MHFGQGKWYPGESLPRWALGCYWRKDGEPIWRNPELIADDEPRLTAPTPPRPEAFITNLAERLDVCPDHVVPGYEDTWYYLWKERRLPVNVDPLKSNLENEEERKRLARIFEHGLSQVVGYALPIRPIYSDGVTTRWESGRWLLRQENMFLLPGDSPMGLRLPLDSLPWYASDDTNPWQERDPLAPRGPLPSRACDEANGNGYARPAGHGPLSPTVAAEQSLGMPLGPSTFTATTLKQVPGIIPADAGPTRGRCIGRRRCVNAPSPSPRRSSPRPRRRPSARRSAWKPAKAACTSSCRRLPGWKITWTSSQPSKTRPKNLPCP